MILRKTALTMFLNVALWLKQSFFCMIVTDHIMSQIFYFTQSENFDLTITNDMPYDCLRQQVCFKCTGGGESVGLYIYTPPLSRGQIVHFDSSILRARPWLVVGSMFCFFFNRR